MKNKGLWILSLIIALILSLSLTSCNFDGNIQDNDSGSSDNQNGGNSGDNNQGGNSDNDGEDDSNLPNISYMQISGAGKVTLAVGESHTFELDVDEAVKSYVKWSVTSGDAVTVNNGTVVAVKAGSATVTASYKSLSCSVEVKVTDVNGDHDIVNFAIKGAKSISITVGKSHSLELNGSYDNVTWSVSSDAVTVDNGTVVAVKAGSARVTASWGIYVAYVDFVVTVEDDFDNNVDDDGWTDNSGNQGNGNQGGNDKDDNNQGGNDKDDNNQGGNENQTGNSDLGNGIFGGNSVAAALSGTVGESYTVKGTVVAFNAQSFLVADTSGAILVYKGASWTPDVAIGDLVEVTGTSSEHGKAVQLGTDSTYSKIGKSESFSHPTPSTPAVSELNAYATDAKVSPKYVKLSGIYSLSTNNDKKYYNLELSGASVVGSIVYPTESNAILLDTLNGSVLEVTGYITGITGYDKYLSIIVTDFKVISNASTPEDSTTSTNIVINGEKIPAYSGNSGYFIVNGNEPFFTAEDKKASAFYSFSNLDSLGRAGAAFACLNQSLMPTDDRDNISSIRPTGWSYNQSYAILSNQTLYNRSHLLAHSLLSDDVHPENFVTGTTYMNQSVMTTFESMVRDYIKGSASRYVLYRVTPYFEGSNLVCSGLLMEAYSVDDNGRSISFCVFLYNVQPGIEIDYRTGQNWLAENGSTGGDNSDDETDVTVPGDNATNASGIFTFGANGSAHADGTGIGASKTFTENGVSLTLTSASKVYDGAYDAKGNSCLKLGTSSEIGKFTFSVGTNVTKVIIKVAAYKTYTSAITVNGETQNITSYSNDGKYTDIVIDTTATKVITVETTTSGKRVMIDSIEFFTAD